MGDLLSERSHRTHLNVGVALWHATGVHRTAVEHVAATFGISRDMRQHMADRPVRQEAGLGDINVTKVGQPCNERVLAGDAALNEVST